MAKARSFDSNCMARALATWADADGARALHAVDSHVIRATEAPRSLVLELFGGAAPARDLFNACARLGALMAEGGGSPSLAASAVGHAARALEAAGAPYDASRLGPATAALFEGYVGAVREAERAALRLSWEYPACAVPLEDRVVAVACGYPLDDADARAAWASRVAGHLLRDGARHVVLSGPDAAKAEVASAVSLVGIEVVGRRSSSGASTERRWLRIPWRR